VGIWFCLFDSNEASDPATKDTEFYFYYRAKIPDSAAGVA
jgi:hypothetical protein